MNRTAKFREELVTVYAGSLNIDPIGSSVRWPSVLLIGAKLDHASHRRMIPATSSKPA